MPKITRHGGPSYADTPALAPAPPREAPEHDDDAPAGNASTGAWRDYAVTCGYPRERVQTMNRTALIELVGPPAGKD